MKIVRYVVERFTGTDVEHTIVETPFPTDGETTNTILDRQAAFNFATSLIHTLLDAENEGISPHQSEYAMGNSEEDRFDVSITVVYDDDGTERGEIIYGAPLDTLIDNLNEEVECYVDNGYDTGGALHNLNLSTINHGNVVVLKDSYDLYHEYVEEMRRKADEGD